MLTVCVPIDANTAASSLSFDSTVFQLIPGMSSWCHQIDSRTHGHLLTLSYD